MLINFLKRVCTNLWVWVNPHPLRQIPNGIQTLMSEVIKYYYKSCWLWGPSCAHTWGHMEVINKFQ